MNDKDFEKLVKSEVSRLMNSTCWGEFDTIPPSGFTFPTTQTDIDIVTSDTDAKHHITLIHLDCNNQVSYSDGTYGWYSSVVDPPRLVCHDGFYCGEYWDLSDVKNLTNQKLATIFGTRETLYGDTTDAWPTKLAWVSDNSSKFTHLAERPMKHEELVEARVRRFYGMRLAFRKVA